MATLGKVFWTALALLGAFLVLLGLALSAFQMSYPQGLDVLLFGLGSFSFLVGLYVWKTDTLY